MSLLHAGLVQLRCDSDVQVNFDRHVTSIRDAAQAGAELVVLQELFRTGYFCRAQDLAHFRLAEPIPGPTSEVLSRLARELHVVIVAPLFEERAAGLYHNSAVVLDSDGRYAGVYRKMHIPDDPDYQEKFYFTPGDLGYPVFQTSAGRIGVLICWDQWFPEAARIVALKGAELIVCPTAIGWSDGNVDEDLRSEELEAWVTVQRSHAIANGIPLIAVNRTGREGDHRFWGNSFACNGHGRVLVRLPAHEESVRVVTLDLGAVSYYRQMWPYLRDRRVDSYGPIVERYIDQ